LREKASSTEKEGREAAAPPKTHTKKKWMAEWEGPGAG